MTSFEARMNPFSIQASVFAAMKIHKKNSQFSLSPLTSLILFFIHDYILKERTSLANQDTFDLFY